MKGRRVEVWSGLALSAAVIKGQRLLQCLPPITGVQRDPLWLTLYPGGQERKEKQGKPCVASLTMWRRPHRTV